MNTIGNRLRLAYYDASDGPRIMLFGPMDADILALQNFFYWLSQGEKSTRLDEQPFIVTFGDVEITSTCTGTTVQECTDGKAQGLRRIEHDRSHFEWCRTSEDWDYLAELIDGMADNRNACHQYLTRYPDEDAIVVVSKGEYSDEIMTG